MTLIPKEPLAHAITPSKQAAKRHYGSHPYFTKRAWNVVQQYISHFSSPGDTVLDPFGGSGVTAVESLVLRRKAIYVDISGWAAFLARQTAIAPVDLVALREAFFALEEQCKPYLDEIAKTPNKELEKRSVRDWYPRDVPLPANADVACVHELFTPRMLHGLAHLRAGIAKCKRSDLRDLLLMAFSATLVRINRTFLSTKDRLESRGGSAIFSIYRYKVAKRPVELRLWDQFAVRYDRLVEAKRETNQLIDDFYCENDTATFRQGSAARLLDFLKPKSVDYIYTDPPYGGHIAYLDLSTMWAAWLGIPITDEDRRQEVIEGGDLKKNRDDYQDLLNQSLAQMHEVLKPGAWMSMVFAHRDTTYWEALVNACTSAGFEYANTVVQPVGVVWSMHKKKNPLRVLSGELVLNFRRPAAKSKSARIIATDVDSIDLVRACCETEIIRNLGATTEDLHHVVIPKLLEAGLLRSFSKEHGDLVPVLKQFFDFDASSEKWHLRDCNVCGEFSTRELARYLIARLLARSYEDGSTVIESEVHKHIRAALNGNGTLKQKDIKELLHELGTSADDMHWLPRGRNAQPVLF